MYRIINTENHQLIGFIVEPHYIRIKPSTGAFVSTDSLHAQGIAYRSTPYNLMGKEGVGAQTTVLLEEFDITDLIVDIPDLENAICELDIANEERFNMIEDALCELDKEEI